MGSKTPNGVDGASIKGWHIRDWPINVWHIKDCIYRTYAKYLLKYCKIPFYA